MKIENRMLQQKNEVAIDVYFYRKRNIFLSLSSSFFRLSFYWLVLSGSPLFIQSDLLLVMQTVSSIINVFKVLKRNCFMEAFSPSWIIMEIMFRLPAITSFQWLPVQFSLKKVQTFESSYSATNKFFSRFCQESSL